VFAETNPSAGSGIDGFVTKLDHAGALAYSTYYGATNVSLFAIAVDANGNATVCGEHPQGFTLPAAPAPTELGPGGGFRDALLAKIDSGATAIVYQTLIGGGDGGGFAQPSGNADDRCYRVALDSSGAAVFLGGTTSDTATDGFPITGAALQSSFAGPGGADPSFGDAFVGKLAADGGSLAFLTYLGGSGREMLLSGSTDAQGGLAIDASGNVFVGGDTTSSDFPLASAHQGSLLGSSDAFVAGLHPNGSSLLFSTYLGGTGGEGAARLALSGGDEIVVAGSGISTDFPLLDPLGAPLDTGDTGGWIGAFSTEGALLFASTFGQEFEQPRALAADAAGAIYLAGTVNQFQVPTFPLVSPAQDTFGGGDADVFVVKLERSAPAALPPAVPSLSMVGLAVLMLAIGMVALSWLRSV
jgi:hypothetical protein